MNASDLSPAATVAVIGLGYVGLPLAVEFGKQRRTIAYDRDEGKIAHYLGAHDPMGEVTTESIRAATHLAFTADPAPLAEADFIIISVPTPVDDAHRPDFGALMLASRTAGRWMKAGATVIYESTVYPGATEEICVPILESESGKRWKHDFHVAYSPERVNPGDRERTLTRISKLVAADDAETLERVAALYGSVVAAGVHKASSIAVAEAAKVIENTQRDLNIALMNELAMLFDRMGLDTVEVLEAAGTKWNFLPFRPGLVGGHCIGVDPYYLTHKADKLGYHPQVILAGRRINDGMGVYVAQQAIKRMIGAGVQVNGAVVNVLGLTFKENCGDLRNSKVADLVLELRSFGCTVHVHDPLATSEAAVREYGFPLTAWDDLPRADALVAAVAHRHYRELPLAELTRTLKRGGVFADVKSCFDRAALVAAGYDIWRL
jgi:UDP-N-acetyl-D-galactosamine dehydrogenase